MDTNPGKDTLTKAISEAKKIGKDADKVLNILKGTEDAKEEVQATSSLIDQLVKTVHNVELACRQRSNQLELEEVDRSSLQGEDTVSKHLTQTLHECHRILKKYTLLFQPWEKENDPGFWKTTGLRFKLATSQKQTLIKLNEQLDKAFTALRVNLQVLQV
jgi:hypothetical protein